MSYNHKPCLKSCGDATSHYTQVCQHCRKVLQMPKRPQVINPLAAKRGRKAQ